MRVKKHIHTDFLVIGGGVGGMQAAIEAAALGLKVVVAEKADTRRSGCAGCGALLGGKCFFDVADGCFYCADCARGAGVSAETLEVLKKCAGEECDPAKVTREGKRRAVKLLYAFFRAKTETEVKALAEYIALPQ